MGSPPLRPHFAQRWWPSRAARAAPKAVRGHQTLGHGVVGMAISPRSLTFLLSLKEESIVTSSQTTAYQGCCCSPCVTMEKGHRHASSHRHGRDDAREDDVTMKAEHRPATIQHRNG